MMKIKVELKSVKYDDDFGKYEFLINRKGYIDLYIDGMMVDTIEDFGKFNHSNMEKFGLVVDDLIEKWDVLSRNKELIL